MTRIVTLLFIILYPIAPGYFKIAGLDSGVIIALVYSFAYMLCKLSERSELRISKRALTLIIVDIFFLSLPLLRDGESLRFIRSVFEYVISIICLYDYVTSENKAEEILNIIVCVAAIFGVIGIFEFITKTSIFMPLDNSSGLVSSLGPDLQVRGNFVRSETTFGHAISYAIYLSFCGIIALQRILTTHKFIYKIEYLLIFTGLFCSISRAPIIIFIVTQLFMLVLYGKKRVIGYCIKAIIAIATSLLLLWLFASNIFKQLLTIFDMVLAIFSESAAQRVGDITNANPFIYRLGLLKVIPNIIKGHFFFGNGSYHQITFSMLGYTYYSIDNAYLSWLVANGLFGLIGYILPIIAVLYVGARTHFISSGKIYLCISILYIMNLFSVASMYEYKIFLILYSLALASYYRLRKTRNILK
jgi:hypothetical protein